MKENRSKELMKYMLENYDVKTADDVAEALKDMFKDSIQEMMNAGFDTSIGYDKNDNIIEKTNYPNGTIKKNVKSKFGEFNIEVPRDHNSEFDPIIVSKNKRSNKRCVPQSNATKMHRSSN
jgi:transposase-like protein